MIQLRWGDEQVWKDLPGVKSIAEAQASWERTKQRGGKLPPDPEFRVVPDP
jgi:hypothetical protein